MNWRPCIRVKLSRAKDGLISHPTNEVSIMKKFLNYHPGGVNNIRALTTSNHPSYGMTDLGDFIDAISAGSTATLPTEGAMDALEDGELLGRLLDKYGWTEEWTLDVVEEIHSILSNQA